MLNIAFGQSKYYVDNLSENIKRGHHKNCEKESGQGLRHVWLSQQPKTKSIDVDTDKSVLVRKCFELYATGDYTLKISSSFWRILNLIPTKAMFFQLPVSSECSKSDFDYGTFRFNGELYEGSHEPIISSF